MEGDSGEIHITTENVQGAFVREQGFQEFLGEEILVDSGSGVKMPPALELSQDFS